MGLKEKEIIKVLKKINNEISLINKKILKKNLSFKSKNKKEIDPVTTYDILIEKKIRSIIKSFFPNHSIIGEEIKEKSKKKRYVWYIDPIDGTKALIMGLPNWSNLIGLYDRSKPILSFANFPVLKRLYYSNKNKTVLKIGNVIKTIKVSNKQNPKKAIIAMNTLSTKRNLIVFNKLKNNNFFLKITGADAMNYCLLCEGRIDVVIESGLKKVDIFPLIKMIKDSGGIVSDWNGNQFYKNGEVIASNNKKLHNYFLNKYLKFNN
jgi:myo-inositol-1(or 4)-monophosphatase